MAHAVVKDPNARLLEQCTQGRFIRNIATLGLIVGNARTNNTAPNRIMADAIAGETLIKGFFIAPCEAKVTRIYVNGSPFIDNNAGDSTIKVTKGVIGGGDTDLCSALTIGSDTLPTADTAKDATLITTAGVLDLKEGQHVYATLVVGATVQSTVGILTLCMEWVPVDSP